jgi:hypothetical protein
MTEMLTITTKRGDDIPWLLAQQRWMGVQSLMDERLPTHRNGWA